MPTVSGAPKRFSFVASTGRTATTFIAKYLDSFDDITALHEGTAEAKKVGGGQLPEINVENRLAYTSLAKARGIVSEKRSSDDLRSAVDPSFSGHLIDVAYYNATIAHALLETHQDASMVGIIRECGSFVRSATTMRGEDPLPVGWPSRSKDLSDRERFISMGRIKPRRGSQDNDHWADYNAIRRNIWLWRETNLCLAEAQRAFPDRVTLIRFEHIRSDPQKFWGALGEGLRLSQALSPPGSAQKQGINKKPFDYQVPPLEQWSAQDLDALNEATQAIEKKVKFYD